MKKPTYKLEQRNGEWVMLEGEHIFKHIGKVPKEQAEFEFENAKLWLGVK